MGIRNYLIEGLSATGKTSVCNELQRRGYHAIMVTANWLIEAIRKLVNRRMASHTLRIPARSRRPLDGVPHSAEGQRM
jgi:predicted ATPase